MYTSDPVLTELEVRTITSETLADFYKIPIDQINSNTVYQFLETLRSSSGLFVEVGQGLFSFMHRVFQEYYAAMYLSLMRPEELRHFVEEHFHILLWQEPIRLLIVYISEQSSHDNDRRILASKLIDTVVDTTDAYDGFLCRNLLFATSCIVDCNSWALDQILQRGIVNRLFDLYGDTFGRGRYSLLRQDIKQVVLLWLLGQPQEMSGKWPTLLETWRIALSSNQELLRQEGAVHLLASLAPDLQRCPASVLHALIPPLLQLAGIQEWYEHDLSCPPEIRQQLFQTITMARPSSVEVEEYAVVALRLLNGVGPAGWLYADWQIQSKERPERLERLSQHSFELGSLLTPVIFSSKHDDIKRGIQHKLADNWQLSGSYDPDGLQIQLLKASDDASFPEAYLLWEMLERELASPTQSWRTTWDSYLQEEMARGNSATYQASFYLRLLLARASDQQYQDIVNDLVTALSIPDQRQQIQALSTISNIYQRNQLNVLGQHDQSELLRLLDPEHILGILSNILTRQKDRTSLSVLRALYSVVSSYDSCPSQIGYQVQSSIQAFVQEMQRMDLLTGEQRHLTRVILLRIEASSLISHSTVDSSAIQVTPEARVVGLYALTQQTAITKQQVQELLTACTDTRRLSEDTRRQEGNASTVQQVAWELVHGQFSLEADALPVVLQALESDNAAIALGAAFLLRESIETLALHVQKVVAQKIMQIFANDESSGRSIYLSDDKIWQLDDVLFETLQLLPSYTIEEVEALSDEALRRDILQRLQQGEIVSKSDYPTTGLTRLQNIMAEIARSHEVSALIYNPTSITIAYRNAEGVRRIHVVCNQALQTGLTDEKRIDSAIKLVQSFLKELALPDVSVGKQPSSPFFFVATAQAGSLTSVLPSEFPIFVPMLSDQQIRQQDVSEIFQRIFNEESPEKRFGLVLSPNDSSLLHEQLTQPDIEGIRENIVYLKEDDMRAIITSKIADVKMAFMETVRRQVKLTFIAPFVSDGPTTGLVFVGRGREMGTILQNIEQHSYAILGGRRIGKTSTAFQVQLRLQRRGYTVLFADCQAVSNYSEFYRTIRSKWTHELATYQHKDDLPVTFRDMVVALEKIRTSRLPLVFVFDEVDRLLDFDLQQENPEQLFRTFRDLSQTRQCQFIFSGERRIYEQCHDSSSPLFNFCTPVMLSLLNAKEAQQLIEKPFALINIPLAGGHVVSDMIVDACSRHPNLIQWTCKHIIELLDQNQTSQPKVSQEIVMQVVNQSQFRQSYMKVFWSQSNALEKAITLLVGAEASLEPARLLSLLQRSGFHISQEQLTIALNYLILCCVLQQDNSRVGLAARHFHEFVQQEILNQEEYLLSLKDQYLEGKGRSR